MVLGKLLSHQLVKVGIVELFNARQSLSEFFLEAFSHAFGNQTHVSKRLSLLELLFNLAFLALVDFNLHIELSFGASKLV